MTCLSILFIVLPALLFGQVTSTATERAEENLERIRDLVKQGALPNSTLGEAEAKVADAQDEAVLDATLYNSPHMQDMTAEEEEQMVAAATRRLERAQTRMDARQKLLDLGIIAKAEMTSVGAEVTNRQLVLELAQNRVKLIDQLRQIVVAEKQLEMHTLSNSMIRYDGKADFKLDELPAIQKDFKAHFHHDLPVSAIGQTQLHASMGLDHSNKVDVALNPEQTEGLWLRSYLEKLHISYLAFRSAVIGAATAPHIHIGTGSTRLLTVSR